MHQLCPKAGSSGQNYLLHTIASPQVEHMKCIAHWICKIQESTKSATKYFAASVQGGPENGYPA